jgi:hypothetical protein
MSLIAALAPALIVSGVVSYSFARLRLRKAAQPLRLQLAEKGERLLGSPNLPTNLRPYVEWLLSTAFGNRSAIFFGFAFVPIAAVMIATRPAILQSFMRKLQINDIETRLLFEEVSRLHDRITLANHPLPLILLEFEVLVFVPLGILAYALIHGRVPESGSSQAIKTFVEVKEQEFFHSRRLSHA